jgi:competence protein ComEC
VHFRDIPFLRIGLPLYAGIVAGLIFTPGKDFFIISFPVIFIFFCISLFFNKYLSNLVFGLALNLSLFLVGLLLFTAEMKNIAKLNHEEAVFEGYLTDYPREKEKTYSLAFKISGYYLHGKKFTPGGSLVLYHRKDTRCPKYLPGDRLMIRCTPVEIENRGNPGEFNYRFYMLRNGVRYYALTDSNDVLKHLVPSRKSLACKALILRNRIIDMYRQRGISGERLALVAAITLGQKNMMEPDQKLSFMKAGVMHVMAVSGLHAVILSIFVFNLFFFLKGRFRLLRAIITVLALWGFAFVTGLTPSVMRATLMFTFLQAGDLLKRKVNPVNSVLASAFALTILRPSVIFDAGFLLSYLAVIFILVFYRDLYLKLRPGNRLADLVWQSAAVTIIAQAGTTPLTIMLFNRFPTWFLASNIIIVPLTSIAIILGCLVPLTFPVKFLSFLFARALDIIIRLTEFLTSAAAALPCSSIENVGMTVAECILLTIFIFFLAKYLMNRKIIPLQYPLVTLLLVVTAGAIKDMTTRTSNELIVFNMPGKPVTGIRTGKLLTLYSDAGDQLNEVTRYSDRLGLKTDYRRITGNNVMLGANGKKILITGNIFSCPGLNSRADIIIYNGILPSPLNRFHEPLADIIVITGDISRQARLKRLRETTAADSVYLVNEQGAFYHRL